MKSISLISLALILSFSACNTADENSGTTTEFDIGSLNLLKGELALCGTGEFGSIDFGQTCMKEVRENFLLGVALLHSFEYYEAEKAFARVIDADPECAIAYWGVAMSNYHPLWYPPNEKELEKGSKAIQIAQSLPIKTNQETNYINAIAVFYEDYKNFNHKTRAERYIQAMEKLYTEFSDDVEAAIFYALALNSVVDPTDKTFAKQRQAGEILNSIFPDEPNHPGIAHYIIHSYDYPELAHLALNSARRYASIAPSSAHAQHMPSHIFVRLGLWEEAVQSNLQSSESAVCYTEEIGEEGHFSQELHALDYLMYAYLQKAQLEEANSLLSYINDVRVVFPNSTSNSYALAAIPSRYVLEQKNWKEAANHERLLPQYPWDAALWEASIAHFTRALGSIHTNDLDNANAELEILERNRSMLIESLDDYRANQVHIQIKSVQAWIAYAEGDAETALDLMTKSANMEDATAKHPVTPGEVLPARELLGDMYMAMEDYENALVTYQLSLDKHQNRFNSLYGAGLAAEMMGNDKKAETFYIQLLEITAGSTGDRSELAHASEFIEKRMDKVISMK